MDVGTTGQHEDPFVMNLTYTGKNGSAHDFVKEMEESGVADGVRSEEGNLRYEYFISKAVTQVDRRRCK